MDRFYLIIQITTTGLQTEYHSPGIDPQDDEVKQTITDERAHVTQISRDSDVYSIQVTKNYRVYSLIVTDTDKFGRSGFYELKLYGPKNYPIDNFVAILQSIKEIYIKTKRQEEYDGVLSSIVVTENNNDDEIIVINQLPNKDYFIYFEENKIDFLKTTFKDKGVYLANKVYALDKNKAAGENTILNVGLEPFDTLKYKIVEIHNPYNVLREIFVNNIVLKSRRYNDKQLLLLNQKDIITYSTSDDDRIHKVVGHILNVQRKPQPQNVKQYSNYTKQSKNSILKENAVYLLALFIIIGAAGLTFSYYKQWLWFSPQNQDLTLQHPPQVNDDKTIKLDSTQIIFDKIVLGGDHLYTTQYNCLDHYTFKFSGNTNSENKWTYINKANKKRFEVFHRGIVQYLNIDKQPALSEEEQINFINELEKVSGQTIRPEVVKETITPLMDAVSKNTQRQSKKGEIEITKTEVDPNVKADEALKKIGKETNSKID